MPSGLLHTAAHRLTGYDVVRIALGLLLLAAGALKAHQLATEPVLGTGLLDSRWLLMATVEFELLFGLWLLANVWPKLTWTAALACFGLFTCVSLYRALSGHTSCGCFGRVSVHPWYTGVIDFVIVLALLRCRPRGGVPGVDWHFNGRSRRAMVVLVVWVSVGVPAAFAMDRYSDSTLSFAGEITGKGELVILDPENWIGKRFPLLPFIEDVPGQFVSNGYPLRERLAHDKWLVLLYHHGCPKCQEAKLEYTALARRSRINPDAPYLAVIEMPPYNDSRGVSDLQEAPGAQGRLADTKKWFVTTPVWLEIRDGSLVAVN